MEPSSLISSSSRKFISSLPRDVINHLFEATGQMYQLTCIHYVWNNELGGMQIRARGRIGLFPTLEMATNVMNNRMRDLSGEWVNSTARPNSVNIASIGYNGDKLILDYKIGDRDYASEEYVFSINRVLEHPFQ